MSFELDISPKDAAGAEFVVKLGKSLQAALLKKKRQGKFTQQDLAKLLDLDRSRVNRCFSGYANLTAETIGQIVWALGGEINLTINFHETAIETTSSALSAEIRKIKAVDARKVFTIGEAGQSPILWVVHEPAVMVPANQQTVAPKIVESRASKWSLTPA